jgi:hypothetical protein
MKMKKMLSVICAAVMCSSAASVISASAAGQASFSFRAGQALPEGVSASGDGSLLINLRLAGKSGASEVKVPVDVFYTEATAGAWYARANWKCSAPADKIKVTDLTAPYDKSNPDNPVVLELDTPYTFARKQSNGKYAFTAASGERSITVNDSTNATLNTMGFTCQTGGSMDGPLVPLGEKTDSYAFASFALSFNPASLSKADYDVHFLTKAEDNPDQRFCEVNINHDIFVPDTADIKVKVIDYLLGDVDNDGFIDSNDASIVLAEYATTSTGGEKSFDDLTFKVADTNSDNLADSNDASSILSYYAYAATESNPKSIEEFLGL